MDALARSLGNVAESRGERISVVLRRSAELQKYLDPQFAEESGQGSLSAEDKADLVVAKERELRKAADLAQRLKDAQNTAAILETTAGSKRPRSRTDRSESTSSTIGERGPRSQYRRGAPKPAFERQITS